MRAVRCDSCGTKALTAASTCPACGHQFEVRDGFGELLPLAYCSSCDSYYPERVGSCRWCGTKPEHAPRGPSIWKGIGVAALVVLGAGSWLMRDSRPKKHAADATALVESPADSVASRTATAPADTVASRVTIASADSIGRDSVRPLDVSSIDTTMPVASPPSVALLTPLGKPSASSSASPSSKARASSRWVNSISKSWVVVRADASKASRIVASIGPSSRVQLGESRGTWRRIKARGVAGWVEPRSSFVTVRAAKAGSLAAR